MAKKKNNDKVSDEQAFADIALATRGSVLSDLDSCSLFIDTGNLAINYICSGKFITGGIPGNRITEFYGPSSSGKSLIASNLLYGVQKIGGWGIILDCENATNAEFMARTSHLNLSKVIRYTPHTLEQAFGKINIATKAIREYEKKNGLATKPIMIVYDSISVSPCEREYREVDLPEDYNPTMWKKIVGAKEQPGERARICSKELRKLMPLLEKDQVSVLFINQTRSKIGVMYGSPETTGGGGNALPFYASCRIRTAARKKIEDKKLKTFAGVNMHIKNVKNRTFRPFAEAEGVKLYFQTGINPLTGLLTSLLQAGRIKKADKGKGVYIVNPEYSGDQIVKFTCTLEANIVPLDILMMCPTLIDATSAKEVEDYMEVFKDAIADSASDDFDEKVVEGEEFEESEEEGEDLSEEDELNELEE